LRGEGDTERQRSAGEGPSFEASAASWVAGSARVRIFDVCAAQDDRLRPPFISHSFVRQASLAYTARGVCGINLIYGFGSPVEREELLLTRDAMRSRGPDAAGEWISADGAIGMGHRRLSIIDVSDRGNQPMTSHDGRYTIVFNGEIYNYRELKRELEADGERFTSDSDTEVLLALFARDRERMLMRLRGMFAFGVWDARERSVFLARDPYGIKPLYYSRGTTAVRVASQVKALLAGGRVSRAIDPAGMAGFLIRGTVPEPFTTHEEIRTVPAGSHLTIDRDGNIDIRKYFSLAQTFREGYERRHEWKRDEWPAIIREAVAESVRYHLVADVPLGCFLSAGKDSTVIMGLAAEAGYADLTALTLRCSEFEGTDQDEAPLARLASDHYGVRHVVRSLDYAEFKEDIPRVLAAMDQPSIDGWNSYFVSKAAAELGLKVMLSGTGGDELFGGYSSFKKIPSFVKLNSPFARIPGWGPGFRKLWLTFSPPGPNRSPKSPNMYRYCHSYESAYLMKRGLFLPEEIDAILPPGMAEEGLKKLELESLIRESITPDPGSGFARVAALESSFFLRDQLLRDVDWASMAHSVEVRVPLVDAHLLRKIAPVLCAAHDYKKSLLAHTPAKPLPHELMIRKKTGFLLPMKEWLQPMIRSGHSFGMRSFALTLAENVIAG
jgi:asparagine synthase (glutamine-hydrolysing)